MFIDAERVKKGIAQAIITNSGCANAATGKEGYRDALTVSDALSGQLKIKEELVLLGSTGVIGKRLPVKKMNQRHRQTGQGVERNWH